MSRKSLLIVIILGLAFGSFFVSLFVFKKEIIHLVLVESFPLLKQPGNEIKIESIDSSTVSLSVLVQQPHFKLHKVRIKYGLLHFLPPVIELQAAYDDKELYIDDLQIASPRIDTSLTYSVGGRWKLEAKASAASLNKVKNVVLRNPKATLLLTEPLLGSGYVGNLSANLDGWTLETDYSFDGEKAWKGELSAVPNKETPIKSLKSEWSIQWGPVPELKSRTSVVLPQDVPVKIRSPFEVSVSSDLDFKNFSFDINQTGIELSLAKYGLKVLPITLNVSGRAVRGSEVVAKKVIIASSVPSIKAEGRAVYNIKHHVSNGIMRFRLKFDEEFKPEDLFPLLKNNLKKVAGSINGEVRLEGRNDKNSITAYLGINELSGEAKGIPVGAVQSEVRLNLFPKLKTPQTQVVRIGKVGKDFALEGLEIPFRFDETSFEMDPISARIAGGRMTVDAFSSPFNNLNVHTTVRLNKLSLQKILAMISSDRLSGEGDLTARIPFHFENDTIAIHNAKLSNESSGIIRYSSDIAREIKDKIETLDDFNELLAKGQEALVFKALHNFHFSNLEVYGEREVLKGVSATLRLKGRNPDLAKGQLFDLVLPITGSVESFLKDTVSSGFMEN